MGAEHYLAIDIGATKTLFAVFNPDGEMVCEKKIKTSSDYNQFKTDVANEIKELSKQFRFSHCCCALPGRVDLENGVGLFFGNLQWTNVPIKSELQNLIPGARVLIHNDAKLAALSEAILLRNKYKKVLYVTISTGIGAGVITQNIIDPDFVNMETGSMLVDFNGQNKRWETFASGKALYEKYGQKASEINDAGIWKEYIKNLVPGFENMLATIQPDVVVIGGGVGAHFEKFQPYLETELKAINNPLVPIPPLLKARRPEEAVIYGCYDYIKQNIE